MESRACHGPRRLVPSRKRNFKERQKRDRVVKSEREDAPRMAGLAGQIRHRTGRVHKTVPTLAQMLFQQDPASLSARNGIRFHLILCALFFWERLPDPWLHKKERTSGRARTQSGCERTIVAPNSIKADSKDAGLGPLEHRGGSKSQRYGSPRMVHRFLQFRDAAEELSMLRPQRRSQDESKTGDAPAGYLRCTELNNPSRSKTGKSFSFNSSDDNSCAIVQIPARL